MKSILAVILMSFLASPAMAEGPLLQCEASRTIPRVDMPGYMIDAEKTIYVSIVSPSIEKHEVGKTTVSTYLNANGHYMLLLEDQEIEASTTSFGNVKDTNGNINLSLNSKGISLFVTCDVI